MIQICILEDLARQILDLESLGRSFAHDCGRDLVLILVSIRVRPSLNFRFVVVKVEG